jgi:Trypsin-like peptidase domain
VADTGYWVEISQGGARLGAGLRLTRHYALTALHCLRGSDADAELDLSFATGDKVHGKVYELCPEADLALIDILEPSEYTVILPPNADRAERGDAWYSPYRPSGSDPYLTGVVSSGSMRYACESGHEIEALQLDVNQPIGGYSGYSGSPVERDAGSGEPALLGMLVEEFPDRRDPDRAANVLFAATIAEALRRFNCLGVGHLSTVLRAVQEVPAVARVPGQPADSGPTAEARARFALLQEVASSGVLSQEHLPELALRLAWNLVDSDLGRAG